MAHPPRLERGTFGSGGAIQDAGYDLARSAIEGTHLPCYFFIAKLAAGVSSTVSGILGGLFASSLDTACYFAGVVQAPMTAFVSIPGMTSNDDNVIALMSASEGISFIGGENPVARRISSWVFDV